MNEGKRNAVASTSARKGTDAWNRALVDWNLIALLLRNGTRHQSVLELADAGVEPIFFTWKLGTSFLTN